LNGQTNDLTEGQPLHFDGTIMPVTDPKLRVEWFVEKIALVYLQPTKVELIKYIKVLQRTATGFQLENSYNS
jgi:hypothetical protein